MSTAFIFPGQGAQHVSMGKDIVTDFPAARDIFQKANDILEMDIRQICFEGPEDQLNLTAVSQPAIFTVSAALLEIFRQTTGNTIKPDFTAGLSMGEYSALYAADLIDFESGLKLVQKRGRAMQQAADRTQGSMVSIIGLDEAAVKELCEKAAEGDILKPVNFNCPGQIVISGSTPACERAVKRAGEMGAIKAVPLAVAGAFHTEMMALAAEQLNDALRQTNIAEPDQIKVIANINADYYSSADQIKTGLTEQLTGAIRWQKSMEKLIADGVDTFYEIGPGRVLTGLMRRIDRKANVINISNSESLKQLSAV